MSLYSEIKTAILEKRSPLSPSCLSTNTKQWIWLDEVQQAFRDCSRIIQQTIPPVPNFAGRGIVICGGGRLFPSVWVGVKALRHHGCTLPIQVWFLGQELDLNKIRLLEELDVQCVDALQHSDWRAREGFAMKSYAIKCSPFNEVLLIDADNSPTKDPEYLFDSAEYLQHGSYFFRDKDHPPNDIHNLTPEACRVFGVPYVEGPSFEPGQIYVDKTKCWAEVCLSSWWNEFHEYTHKFNYFDKDTYNVAWKQTGRSFFLVNKAPTSCIKMDGYGGLLQFDHNGDLLFLHRCGAKWKLSGNPLLEKRPQERLLHSFIDDLVRKLRVYL